MFTHLLPDSEDLFLVEFDEYAERHFRRDFRKKYKGVVWDVTEDSIRRDLAHIGNATYDLQRTQQVDELWSNGEVWVFKYDFRVAKTKVSAKAAGNRAVGVLNRKTNRIKIVLIYNKTDLPKKVGETQYIKMVVNEEFPEVGWR